MTAANEEYRSGHDPSVGSCVSGEHAHRLPDRAVGGWLEDVCDQLSRAKQNRRQACRDNRPGGYRVTGRHRPCGLPHQQADLPVSDPYSRAFG
jgi:hypothetical protein